MSAEAVTRRSALLGLGSCAAAGFVAACGSDEQNSAGTADTSSTQNSATQEGVELGPASEVPVGGAKIFKKAKVVVTQPKAGEFLAFSAICTHNQLPVTDIQPEGIQCRRHGSLFDLTDGSVKNGPAQTPLAATKVTVTAGTLVLGRLD